MLRLFRNLFLACLVVLGCVSAVFWYLIEYTDHIPRDVVKHIESVWLGSERLDGGRTPGELLRHAEKRLYGHTRLEAIFLPAVHLIQRQVERPVPDGEMPTLGKGQQVSGLLGKPISGQRRYVENVDELRQAMATAPAGTVIELLPGVYRINKKLETVYPGASLAPVVVRAAGPGKVFIEFNTVEGFHVTQPHWLFENLNIKGVCTEDRYCEHAFHIVGKARQTTIRNNRIEDFNAHIKVNGLAGEWPDDGILEFNTLTNSRRRETHLPVTPFDLVGANGWVVSDNVVSNFVKGDGDKVSYGVFMKGGSREGRIERNLVICTQQGISQPGVRVGISLGGGGTGKSYCRDGACKAEHFSGVVSNNIVAHCNDFGIDVFRSSRAIVAHNTLINTAGIDVRVEPASALVYGNLLEGRIRSRTGGQLKAEMNESVSMNETFVAPDRLDLEWTRHPEKVPSLASVSNDFCAHPRAAGTFPGALAEKGFCWKKR